MIPLTLQEVADAVGGRLHRADPAAVVTGGVEFDSRRVGPGGLFVAMPGEKVDGHDFAGRAVEAGAVAVLAAREVDAPAVIVPPVSPAHSRAYALSADRDGSGAAVLAGLAALARAVVDRLTESGLTVVGITGSSGKTSTKDLIAQLLTPMGPTVAPPGSFNNELGHPWTALRADADTSHLVLELSARGPGHIAALCETAPPRIGAVLNVGSAHLGEFGSRADIARTKGELVEKLPADGVAILNADDPLVAAMAERTRARVVLVGEAEAAHVRATGITLDEQARASFRLVTDQGQAKVSLALHGAHHVGNALTAAAVALELGATPQEVADRLSGAQRVSARRMEVITRPDGVTVVNDSYNANPESVRAALKTLATMARTGNRRRSWAVLGVMGELGDSAVQAHDEIGRLAVRLDINRLVVVGEQARAMHQGASLEGSWGEESVLVPDVDAAVALLRAELAPGDVVLVKASKAAALWRVAEALLAEDAR
ncbi:UDP-N-acetylmuramoyl-tripeptide--D-alanyl-D-alanine ligase [Actinokineospora iranica]|uniref:UDP-N-acetylmuramoyl-tripeptide--D-alanyl-D-alanine ligase n=1 Tax=Actinokineospora iranica TaxID=1271860 RepID=A0A1G6KF52_9PSEU|nr:UDP-N-acetylmuramoyl-tripeptide--D-alanyl-D-alanine ligase [Actinokineospora iranica]SDC29709.1 UDP-N-acetylmuramoyl-tripeptide--D-alanyl-D-alanine ligase [Actinokineospora iranica]